MPLTELNHGFVQATNLEVPRRFYCDVLGFEEMPRPARHLHDYWLGSGGAARRTA